MSYQPAALRLAAHMPRKSRAATRRFARHSAGVESPRQRPRTKAVSLPVPRDREAKPVGAASWGRALRSARRLARNVLLLLVVVLDVVGGGAGEGEEAAGDPSPHFTPAWEAAKLAMRRRSTSAGARDAMAGDGSVSTLDERAHLVTRYTIAVLLVLDV